MDRANAGMTSASPSRLSPIAQTLVAGRQRLSLLRPCGGTTGQCRVSKSGGRLPVQFGRYRDQLALVVWVRRSEDFSARLPDHKLAGWVWSRCQA